jgi:hypothetical protein
MVRAEDATRKMYFSNTVLLEWALDVEPLEHLHHGFETRSRRRYCGIFAQSKNCGARETTIDR